MDQAERNRRFDEYLAHQRGRLVAIARVYASHDSEDLLQEILLQIWKSLDQFHELARLETWAYRIAINTSLQWQRSASRNRKYLPPEVVDISSIGQRGPDVDPAALLDQFLATLTGTDKAVIVMHLDGLSIGDMADVLGVAEGAVRVRLHRIKSKVSDWSGEQR